MTNRASELQHGQGWAELLSGMRELASKSQDKAVRDLRSLDPSFENMSQQNLERWEKGTQPSPRYRQALQRVLGLTDAEVVALNQKTFEGSWESREASEIQSTVHLQMVDERKLAISALHDRVLEGKYPLSIGESMLYAALLELPTEYPRAMGGNMVSDVEIPGEQ